jgi:hypothetical protein
VADIRVSSLDETLAQAYDLCVDGVTLRFHLPNSRDLAAIVTADGLPAARRVLLQRCLHQTTRDGTVLALSDVPETVLAMLTEQMFDLDPQAGLRFNLACEACGQQWSAPFDIAAFVWTEIAAMAQRLLHEVHILAMTYGWHESDILAMDAVRRQLYLDMIGA